MPRAIDIIAREDDNLSRSGRAETVSKSIDVGQLRERFREFMASLQSIVAIEEPEDGQFSLTEIQFSAEITASGDFKLLGTGVGIEASSAVTFVLERKWAGSQAKQQG
jgi:hypothetical protein